MEQLRTTGLGAFLTDAAGQGTPIFGICLGSQIIFDYSEEGDVECLGLVRGAVRHLKQVWMERPDASEDAKSGMLKVPHMGWNEVPGWGTYYFVHSYIICPKDEKVVVGAADYGVPVPAVIRSGNIMATQFHPEKSGEAGLQLLRDFCEGKPGGNTCLRDV
jgi:glutamine amidotransferase